MIVHCQRCHAPCQTGRPDAKARILQFSAGPKGYCVNCAVTEFFKDEECGVSVEQVLRGSTIEDEAPPDVAKTLLLPHVQKQFAAVLRAGFAQARPDEIDWLKVVANWDLPFPRISTRRAPRRKRKVDQ